MVYLGCNKIVTECPQPNSQYKTCVKVCKGKQRSESDKHTNTPQIAIDQLKGHLPLIGNPLGHLGMLLRETVIWPLSSSF
jgi:hypothetical protein